MLLPQFLHPKWAMSKKFIHLRHADGLIGRSLQNLFVADIGLGDVIVFGISRKVQSGCERTEPIVAFRFRFHVIIDDEICHSFPGGLLEG